MPSKPPSYEVIKKFGLYDYNPVTKASKIVWYDVGTTINETTYLRLGVPARSYLVKPCPSPKTATTKKSAAKSKGQTTASKTRAKSSRR